MANTLGKVQLLPDHVSETASTSLNSTAAVTTLVVGHTPMPPFFILTSTQQGDVTDDDRESISEKWISLSFTWSGRSFTLQIADSDRLDHCDETLVRILMVIKDIRSQSSYF
jgi:hypothetical protein